jgi:hypothetical protein
MKPIFLLCVSLLIVVSIANGGSPIKKTNHVMSEKKAKNGQQSVIAMARRLSTKGDVVAKLHIPHSSLAKVNVLMLLFYSTLGAAMPFIPLWYRKLGIPGESATFYSHVKVLQHLTISSLAGTKTVIMIDFI